MQNTPAVSSHLMLNYLIHSVPNFSEGTANCRGSDRRMVNSQRAGRHEDARSCAVGSVPTRRLRATDVLQSRSAARAGDVRVTFRGLWLSVREEDAGPKHQSTLCCIFVSGSPGPVQSDTVGEESGPGPADLQQAGGSPEKDVFSIKEKKGGKPTLPPLKTCCEVK